MRYGISGLFLGSALLAGCGGGGSGGGTVSAPSPTPAPLPTISYTKIADMTGDRQYSTACSGLRVFGGTLPLIPSEFGGGYPFLYSAASSTYSMTIDGVDHRFGPEDRVVTTAPGRESFARVTSNGTQRLDTGSSMIGDVPVDYVRRLSLTSPTAASLILCIYGVPTLVSDRPTSTASITYGQSNVAGGLMIERSGTSRSFSFVQNRVALDANPVTGEVIATIRLAGMEIINGVVSTTVTEFGTFRGTAAVDGVRSSYQDSFINTDLARYSGSFSGWFFGPRGRESAFVFSINDSRNNGERLFAYGSVLLRQ